MQIQNGHQVRVHYTGRFEDGTVFDSSYSRNEPIEFEVGAGQMIKGFDSAVVGMKASEKKEVSIVPEEAYGTVRDEYFFKLNYDQFPPDANPQVGDSFMMNLKGNEFPVRVAEILPDGVLIDANHPMAGRTLYFEIEVVSFS